MKPIAILTLLAAILFAVFVMANWAVVIAPTTLSFLAFTINAPLGIVLLGAILVIAILFALYAASLRTSMFVTGRRHAQELREQRELADKAEASRFTELGAHIDREFAQLRTELREVTADVAARSESLRQAIERSMGEATNTFAAHMGQISDQLDHSARALDTK